MTKRRSALRIVSAAIAAAGLWWLVSNVNAHGDHIQRDFRSYYEQRVIAPAALPVIETRHPEGGGGLDLIHMYECMCGGPIGADIRGWFGLWLVTVLVGGLPTAILARSAANYAKP